MQNYSEYVFHAGLNPLSHETEMKLMKRRNPPLRVGDRELGLTKVSQLHLTGLFHPLWTGLVPGTAMIFKRK